MRAYYAHVPVSGTDRIEYACKAAWIPLHTCRVGLETFDWWMEMKGGTDYTRIPPGESIDLQLR
jgi:hypothetical protein